MPIEIRELQINVNVNQPQGSSGGQQAQAEGSDAAAGAADKENLVNQCIEQVFEILRSKKER